MSVLDICSCKYLSCPGWDESSLSQSKSPPQLCWESKQNEASGSDEIARPQIWIHTHAGGLAEPNAVWRTLPWYLGIWPDHRRKFIVEDVNIKILQENSRRSWLLLTQTNKMTCQCMCLCLQVRIQVKFSVQKNQDPLVHLLLPLILFSSCIHIL